MPFPGSAALPWTPPRLVEAGTDGIPSSTVVPLWNPELEVEKYQGQKTIESETVKTSEVIKKKLEEITGTVKESLDEVSKSDIGRRIKEGVEEAAKTAKQSAESVTKGGEKLGRTAAFKAISQGVETVKKEIDESVLGQTGPYKRPERLRKRTEYSGERIKEERIFEANEEAMGMVLHKDSKWYQQWKDFKDNNVVFNTFEAELLGKCPGALISGELEILKDWCYEAIHQKHGSCAWEPGAVSLPWLIPGFSLQDKVLRMLYVWALCRDQDELNPYAAWRLLDISSSSTEQVL
ncbi:PREDICTED: mitochondrial import inner membrane translocase subunit TIM44 [Lepidothrix coronata]|uniref:Mitochondrial import inner membrane translocase subunit TIM44 n=1 Tax=Lepidothrix coronata TaxID=321398 RepID=A0A6J0J5P6_9PASS|nr:PREDICTED: mitochondrial import inner membrane translocase subunit TIM44 [Lepidothrix coronata]